MPNDLLQDGAEGFSVIPPDQQSNTQRIFVPRAALAEMTVIGVIGEKTGRRGRRPEDTRQVPMFHVRVLQARALEVPHDSSKFVSRAGLQFDQGSSFRH